MQLQGCKPFVSTRLQHLQGIIHTMDLQPGFLEQGRTQAGSNTDIQ